MDQGDSLARRSRGSEFILIGFARSSSLGLVFEDMRANYEIKIKHNF